MLPSAKYHVFRYTWRSVVGVLATAAAYGSGSIIALQHASDDMREKLAKIEYAHTLETDQLKAQLATAVNRPAPILVPPAAPHAPAPVVKHVDKPKPTTPAPVEARPLFSPTPLWDRD